MSLMPRLIPSARSAMGLCWFSGKSAVLRSNQPSCSWGVTKRWGRLGLMGAKIETKFETTDSNCSISFGFSFSCYLYHFPLNHYLCQFPFLTHFPKPFQHSSTFWSSSIWPWWVSSKIPQQSTTFRSPPFLAVPDSIFRSLLRCTHQFEHRMLNYCRCLWCSAGCWSAMTLKYTPTS